VQVEDITGRIQKIGVRASVIRHLDGIDTLVPNSTLLENRVSNWTFGDSTLRGEILVGVAYGSPTREVTRCLLAVAEQHGLVVKPPKPEVRFADFGDNALVFRLLFWFDANKVQREPLASDLRYMIEGAFADAGIVMAFPQRDLHFDNDKPLRIEFSKAERQTGSQAGLKSEPSV
jgi:small-conductance mechanosensitive channel